MNFAVSVDGTIVGSFLSSGTVAFTPADHGCATATVATTHGTGVEMEALTAVSAALLTVYDMAKALDKGMVIGGVRLLEKRGGKSGEEELARYFSEQQPCRGGDKNRCEIGKQRGVGHRGQ